MTAWTITEPDVQAAAGRFRRPLEALAAAETPAIVLRDAFPEAACRALIEKLAEDDLLYDPRQPIPERFREQVIPEGHYRDGLPPRGAAAEHVAPPPADSRRARIDIGTSLGYRGTDREDFFAHSQQAHALFAELFPDEAASPIAVLYRQLEQLSVDKRVMTAREPDGRLYGPAIIRAHYGGYTYKPHFDSVRLREHRSEYAVHDFEHQFAGVLVLQNTQDQDRSAQCVLHRCLWSPAVDPSLKRGEFHQYAEQNGIGSVEVQLEPGDLYFFNTRCIHEVPGVAGELPRIVLATFIGFSPSRDEIFVWS